MDPLLIELHFLPCLEYFCLLLSHQKVYLEAHESYVKGSYRNKTRIVTANGIQTLSVPQTDSYVPKIEGKIDLRHKILPKLKTWLSPSVQTVPYEQVFADRQDFIANACILDLLFCKGPESSLILEDMIF